jgi:putative addiction module component (TIGR02574 family)
MAGEQLQEFSMSTTLATLGIDRMSVEEQIALIGEIWDTIAKTSEKIPLTEEQKKELDRRIAAYKADPSKVTPWEVVKAEARARSQQ